jgi:rod shape-determining protein MreC
MTDRRRRPRALLALLMLIALMLITIDFRAGDDGALAQLQRRALAVFAPLQEGVATLTRPVGEVVGAIGALGERQERIAELERELERVRQRRFAMADLERENAELRELLDMRERREFTTRASRIIAPPPGASRWTALVAAGADQGVERNMAVINANGLVGKVVTVTDSYSRIRLAASPQARYAVRLARNGEQALLSGRGERPMELELIEESEVNVEGGTQVVTRAYQGASMPDGLPVGRIVQGGPVEPTTSYSVAPVVDFSRLGVVMVVLDAPKPPFDLDDGEADAGPSIPGDGGAASPTPSPSIEQGAALPRVGDRPPETG